RNARTVVKARPTASFRLAISSMQRRASPFLWWPVFRATITTRAPSSTIARALRCVASMFATEGVTSKMRGPTEATELAARPEREAQQAPEARRDPPARLEQAEHRAVLARPE